MLYTFSRYSNPTCCCLELKAVGTLLQHFIAYEDSPEAQASHSLHGTVLARKVFSWLLKLEDGLSGNLGPGPVILLSLRQLNFSQPIMATEANCNLSFLQQ